MAILQGPKINNSEYDVAEYVKGKTNGFNNLCILSTPPLQCNSVYEEANLVFPYQY